jgi:outer membrane protein assembly factor BamD
MMLRFRRNTLVLLFLAFLGLAAGCAGKDVDESDPAALMKEAEEEIENDHFQLAVDKLRAVKNKFPYSKYAVDAQLRIADVYFLQESFAEAALAYESFRDLHPKHEKTAYAMFRIAKSYQNDMPGTVARDMTSGYRALEAYNEFAKRFPAAPEAEDARRQAADVRRVLAEKELYVAEFYFKRDDPYAAKGRFAKIVELYPETDSARIARERLAAIGNPPRKEAPAR